MHKTTYAKAATLLLPFLFGVLPLKAQWSDVGTFNQSINDLKSHAGSLWIGGNFTKVNAMTCYWSAAYNGSTYSLHTNLIGGTGVKRFEVFNNTLFNAGGMDFATISSWNGNTWESEGSANGSCTGIYADGNDLYVGSDFGGVFKRTGSGSFTALPAFNANDDMNAFAKFNGQIVVAGNFGTVAGTVYNNIAAWNGNSWVPLDLGINGTVYSLAVYKNELYAAGNFSQAGGQDAKYIAKWNGNSWSSVDGSVTESGLNGIRDMAIINNTLFVVGDFSEIGDVGAISVAAWNGNNWKGYDFTESNDFPNCIEAYNGKIYVGTLSFTSSRLFRFNGTVATQEPFALLDFRCAPNPATDQVEIRLSDQAAKLELTLKILDASGRILLEDRAFQQSANYSCAAWPAGVYQILLTDETGQIRGEQRMVKQ